MESCGASSASVTPVASRVPLLPALSAPSASPSFGSSDNAALYTVPLPSALPAHSTARPPSVSAAPWQSFPQGMIKLSGNTQPDLQLVNTQTFITYPGLPMKWLWWGLHLLSKVLCLLWGVNCGGMRHHCHIKLNFAAPRPLWLISHSLLPCLFLIFHNLL